MNSIPTLSYDGCLRKERYFDVSFQSFLTVRCTIVSPIVKRVGTLNLASKFSGSIVFSILIHKMWVLIHTIGCPGLNRTFAVLNQPKIYLVVTTLPYGLSTTQI